MSVEANKLKSIKNKIEVMLQFSDGDEKDFYNIILDIIAHTPEKPEKLDPYEIAAKTEHAKSPFLYANLTERTPNEC